jgi:hypothetical protein
VSDITVNVTNAGATNVAVSSASTVNTTVGNGGTVSVSIGAISPGDATVVSGTVQVGKVTTLAPGSAVTVVNSGTAYSATLDFGIPGTTTDASLLSTGTVPDARLASNIPRMVNNLLQAANLPSYVDDVVDVGATLPSTGETGKIYVVSTGTDVNKIYRWSGSTFIEISPSPGSTDAVPEGSGNLYYTNARAAAAAPVQSVSGRTGAVTLTASDVGLGNVNNTSDANKPVSTAQASADAAVQAYAIQRANHTGTQTASTISDFAAEAAKYGPVTSVVGRTGAISLSTSDIPGLQAAIDGKQVAGNYVTSVNDLYNAVKLAAGTNIAITSSSQTITVASTGLGKNDSVDCGFFYGVSSPTIFITTQPSSQTASSGSANFSVSAYVTHDGTLSYQWQKKKAGGITWTQRTLPASIDWKSVAYGNNTFVAVGYGAGGGTGNIAATSPDGINWTQQAMPASREWTFVTYGNGVFLAITKGSDAATSTDGKTWTSQSLPSGTEWSSVTYGNGRFVAITDGTTAGTKNVAATSTNGSSWTQQTLPAEARWTGIAYGNNTFVAVSQLSSDVAATSPDGATWTKRTMPIPGEWSSIAFGNGLFVAVDYYRSRAARSTDGISWTESSILGDGWTYVTYGDNAFFAVAYTGTSQGYVARSTDGITWTIHSLSAGTRYASIAYGNGIYAAVSSNSSAASSIASSAPGSAGYANVTNATGSVLSLSSLTNSTDDLDQYRVTLTSDAASSVTSSAATLRVS